ncbi:MAG: M48 family metalloprotease [Candidatus Aenigmarchaeota archaeon]|nr:M48 family metalloprotease [Candidatus Aenigmarchaeota archaeon]
MSSMLRAVLLLGFLTGIFLAIGFYFGGIGGMSLGLVLAFATNFFSYWYADKFVLALYGAKPYGDRKMNHIVEKIAEKAGIPKPPLYIVNMDVPNAFATGRNAKHAAIAVTKGLVDKLNDKEIEAVLSHEIGHVTNKDVLIGTLAATIAGAISWLAYVLFYGSDQKNRNALSFVLLFFLAPVAATLVRLAISRSRELSADKTGAMLSNPEDLISALQKISAHAKATPLQGNSATSHLFIVNPFSGASLAGLFSSHPPLETRVARLKEMKP